MTAAIGLAQLDSPVSAEHSAASSQAAKKIAVLCFNHRVGEYGEYVRREKPKRCTRFGPRDVFAGGIYLKKIRWKNWGAPIARGKAIECGAHLPCQDIRVKVKAYRPADRCGHRVYTKINAKSKHGRSRTRTVVCPGPPFGL